MDLSKITDKRRKWQFKLSKEMVRETLTTLNEFTSPGPTLLPLKDWMEFVDL